jgi:hypothetical protein
MAPRSPLDELAHDVHSTCAALIDAAKLMRGVSPKEADEILGLMGDQATGLARAIADCRETLSGKGSAG